MTDRDFFARVVALIVALLAFAAVLSIAARERGPAPVDHAPDRGLPLDMLEEDRK